MSNEYSILNPGANSNHGGQDGAIRRSKEMCYSAKRTHFVFADFSLYHFVLQKLMPFAAAFANGFVLEKRTHFWVFTVGSVAAKITSRRFVRLDLASPKVAGGFGFDGRGIRG